jgi:hypothetical protein
MGHGLRAESVTFLPHPAGSDLVGTVPDMSVAVGYHRHVAEESAQPLEQQLEEIRTQLAWVRDYL